MSNEYRQAHAGLLSLADLGKWLQKHLKDEFRKEQESLVARIKDLTAWNESDWEICSRYGCTEEYDALLQNSGDTANKLKRELIEELTIRILLDRILTESGVPDLDWTSSLTVYRPDAGETWDFYGPPPAIEFGVAYLRLDSDYLIDEVQIGRAHV